MDNYIVRRAVMVFFRPYQSWYYMDGPKFTRSQNDFALFFGVRPATVSSWMNCDSDISLFTFLRICQAFAVHRKVSMKVILLDFVKIFEKSLITPPDKNF